MAQQEDQQIEGLGCELDRLAVAQHATLLRLDATRAARPDGAAWPRAQFQISWTLLGGHDSSRSAKLWPGTEV
jgi:hypothetical protein